VVTVEPAVFAQEEINAVRTNVLQIFAQHPPNLDQANSDEALVIAQALLILKSGSAWKCNTGDGKTALTCSSWQLLLG
jgi:hypothetical protein